MESKVYGFIGVIGSGKSYTANLYKERALAADREVITVDFSDGIREFVRYLIAGDDGVIDPLCKEYGEWKKAVNTMYLPERPYDFYTSSVLAARAVTGRELLQRIGEGIKKVAGDDVWARMAGRKVRMKYDAMPDERRDGCDIIFGSLRFTYEAEELFRTAEYTGKKPEVILCDYHSDAYKIENHESEKLAQLLLSRCRPGNVTDEIRRLCYDE